MSTKEEIKNIQKRNKKVELDKAWEVSFTRKLLLTIFIYIAIGLYLQAVNIPKPWLNAIVPAIGFMLSTSTLPFLKKIWAKYIFTKTRNSNAS